jgi:hypothetical protein
MPSSACGVRGRPMLSSSAGLATSLQLALAEGAHRQAGIVQHVSHAQREVEAFAITSTRRLVASTSSWMPGLARMKCRSKVPAAPACTDRATDSEKAARLVARMFDHFAGGLRRIEHFAAAGVVGFTKRRYAHLSCGPAEQLHTQFLLELCNPAGKSRFRHAGGPACR